MSNLPDTFTDLGKTAEHLRNKLTEKKYILLFAYNGTGKTRLSMEFKDLGKNGTERDTLYYNAFTEDLFYWDNDLESDTVRELRLNTESAFFNGIFELEMESRIRDFLIRYADFDFKILTKDIEGREVTYVSFEREVLTNGRSEIIDGIKISRGEENVFIWCFFLAVVQLAFDTESQGDPYSWVKYIYIDDPISSLDENNLIFVACDLVKLISDEQVSQKIIISTHHSLFFNVLSNEMKGILGRNWQKKLVQYFFRIDREDGHYSLIKEAGDTPYSYHLAIMEDLQKAITTNSIRTYHFNMMRSILEKTSAFFGYKKFTDCIRDEAKVQIYSRFLNLFSHGKDSFFTYREPDEAQKELFKEIFNIYLNKYEPRLADTLVDASN